MTEGSIFLPLQVVVGVGEFMGGGRTGVDAFGG